MNFFDDLDKLNKNKDDNFKELNNKIYNEHDFILSSYKNSEFFESLCNMCKYEKIPYNENGFTQENLDQITFISTNELKHTFFENVTSLDELQYFHNLKFFYNYSFNFCTKLKSVILPENTQKISMNLFSNCISLKEIKLPENFNEISYGAFENSYFLKKIIISENIKNIGDCAFSGCSSLKEIVIPKNIKNIGDFAFEHCFSLEKIIIPERFKNSIHSIFHKVDLSKVNITYI